MPFASAWYDFSTQRRAGLARSSLTEISFSDSYNDISRFCRIYNLIRTATTLSHWYILNNSVERSDEAIKVFETFPIISPKGVDGLAFVPQCHEGSPLFLQLEEQQLLTLSKVLEFIYNHMLISPILEIPALYSVKHQIRQFAYEFSLMPFEPLSNSLPQVIIFFVLRFMVT